MLGPYHQPQEVSAIANSGHCVSRPAHINTYDADITGHREAQQDKAGSQSLTVQVRNLCTKAGSICEHDSSSKTGNLDESTLPLILASSDKQCYQWQDH